MIVFGIIRLMSQDEQLVRWVNAFPDPSKELLSLIPWREKPGWERILEEIISNQRERTNWRWIQCINSFKTFEHFYMNAEIGPHGVFVRAYKKWTPEQHEARTQRPMQCWEIYRDADGASDTQAEIDGDDPYPGLLVNVPIDESQL